MIMIDLTHPEAEAANALQLGTMRALLAQWNDRIVACYRESALPLFDVYVERNLRSIDLARMFIDQGVAQSEDIQALATELLARVPGAATFITGAEDHANAGW